MKARGRSQQKPAVKWLKRRAFDDLERIADAKDQWGHVDKVFVARGTAAWNAWVSAGHKDTLVTQRDGKGALGWYFDTEFPERRRCRSERAVGEMAV